MNDSSELSVLTNARVWQSDRRQWMTAAGLSLTGALPLLLGADQIEGQPPISAGLSEKYRALLFWSALNRMEFSSQLIAGSVAAGGKGDDNAMGLKDLGNYYLTAWTTAQRELAWAKGTVDKHQAEVSTLASWAINRFPLSNDQKGSLSAAVDKAGGAGKVAQKSLETLESVGIAAGNAIRNRQQETGIPLDNDPDRRSSLACSLIGSEVLVAAMAGQWELLTTMLVKLQLRGCI